MGLCCARVAIPDEREEALVNLQDRAPAHSSTSDTPARSLLPAVEHGLLAADPRLPGQLTRKPRRTARIALLAIKPVGALTRP